MNSVGFLTLVVVRGVSMETQSPKKIYGQLMKIMRDVDAIGKTRANAQQGFKFRGIDEMYNELHSKFAEHGVFTTTEVIDQRREDRQTKSGGNLTSVMLTIRFTFHADDASSVSSVLLGEAMDSGDKASNKAISIAHKYALLTMFMIPTEEPKDPDAESHDVAPRSPKQDVKPTAHPKAFPPTNPLTSFERSVAVNLAGQVSKPTPPAPTGNKLASEAQLNRLFVIAERCGVTEHTIHNHIKITYGLNSVKDLDWKQYKAVVEWIELPASDPSLEMPGEFGQL